MTDAVLIGVDGGGSGCRAALRLPGGRIHRADGGPANVSTDAAAAIRNVRAAIDAAASAAGMSAAGIAGARAHLGLAGVLDGAAAARVAAAMPMRDCTVSDDREVQVLGALGGRDGFVVAIGTGTIVARCEDGRVRGVGGWGFALSDRGSGADLGREALRAALLAADGIAAPSPMTDLILSEFGGPSGIVRFAARAGAAEYAALAPRVIAAAGAGDAHGRAILAAGAAHLDAALDALGFGPGDLLCLTGGIGPAYRGGLAAAGAGELAAPAGTALDGALALAGAARASVPTP